MPSATRTNSRHGAQDLQEVALKLKGMPDTRFVKCTKPGAPAKVITKHCARAPEETTFSDPRTAKLLKLGKELGPPVQPTNLKRQSVAPNKLASGDQPTKPTNTAKAAHTATIRRVLAKVGNLKKGEVNSPGLDSLITVTDKSFGKGEDDASTDAASEEVAEAAIETGSPDMTVPSKNLQAFADIAATQEPSPIPSHVEPSTEVCAGAIVPYRPPPAAENRPLACVEVASAPVPVDALEEERLAAVNAVQAQHDRLTYKLHETLAAKEIQLEQNCARQIADINAAYKRKAEEQAAAEEKEKKKRAACERFRFQLDARGASKATWYFSEHRLKCKAVADNGFADCYLCKQMAWAPLE